jgi:hypothetical protein
VESEVILLRSISMPSWHVIATLTRKTGLQDFTVRGINSWFQITCPGLRSEKEWRFITIFSRTTFTVRIFGLFSWYNWPSSGSVSQVMCLTRFLMNGQNRHFAGRLWKSNSKREFSSFQKKALFIYIGEDKISLLHHFRCTIWISSWIRETLSILMQKGSNNTEFRTLEIWRMVLSYQDLPANLWLVV